MTIGQYLQPTPKHAEVDRFVTPEHFKSYAEKGQAKGLFDDGINPFDTLFLSRRC